jgi:hypothetical protein
MIIEDFRLLYESHKQRRTHFNVTELSNWLRVAASKYSRLFCVVDALDELAENTRLRLISEINKLPSHTYVLFTSRYSLDTEKLLSDSLKLEIQAQESDLRSYLADRAVEEPRLRRHIQKDPALLEDILDKIVSKAQGM